MKRLLTIISLWLLPMVGASARNIAWTGDRPEDARAMERRIRALESAGVSPAMIADSATEWLQTQGYLDARAVTLDSGIDIAAGPRCFLSQVTIYDQDTTDYDVYLPFTAGSVELSLEEALGALRDEGFPYVGARVRELVRAGAQVSLVVEIERGPQVTMAALDYRGLTRSRPDVIERYLDFKSGEILTDRALSELERRAAGIPFVRFEPPVAVRSLPGFTEAVVGLTFEEKRQFNLSGGAGYIPGENYGLVWNLDLRLVNLFGRGRELRIQSERREERRNNLLLGYAQPLFILGPDRLAFRVTTRDYRENFYEFELAGSYEAHLRSSLSTGLGLAWKRVEPADASASYSAYSIEYSLGRSILRDPLNPRDGYAVAAALGYTYRRYAERDSSGSGEAFNETRAKLSAHFYQPLLGRVLAYLGLNYRGLETGETEPPLAELFLIGGPGTLRGWRNEQFAAQRTAYGTFEPRVRFDRTYLFGFYDGAYVNRRRASPIVESTNDELYRSGFGLGMAVIDRGRSLVLSLGWNDRDGFDQPRLSVQFSADL